MVLYVLRDKKTGELLKHHEDIRFGIPVWATTSFSLAQRMADNHPDEFEIEEFSKE